MTWANDIDLVGLPVYIQGSGIFADHRGEIVGFFIRDEATIKAIRENDPRILEVLRLLIGPKGRDLFNAHWANDGYWWEVIAGYDDYEEILESLLINEFASENIRTQARETLAKLAQKAAKKHHTKRRRTEFQEQRDRLALALIERDGYTCAECGAFENLTIDHIMPISKGGSDDLDNLRFLCRGCNSKKGDR